MNTAASQVPPIVSSRKSDTAHAPRVALLTWLRDCPRDQLRATLASLPFRRLQQLHGLPDFDPPTDPTPSVALSQEARALALAKRAAAGLALWNRDDLIHQHASLDRLGRVVSRRRNGSISVEALKRVDYSPPETGDEWETLAAELAADAAAHRREQISAPPNFNPDAP